MKNVVGLTPPRSPGSGLAPPLKLRHGWTREYPNLFYASRCKPSPNMCMDQSFTLAQNTNSTAKGRQFTEDKVTQRLVSFHAYTYLAIYRYT